MPTNTITGIEICNELTDELKLLLELGPDVVFNEDGSITSLLMEGEVERFRGLKVLIHPDEHPPPHFCVVTGEGTANYRINDCVQTNGGLKKYYKHIRRWHSANRDRLIAEWNRLRPTHCSVGQFR